MWTYLLSIFLFANILPSNGEQWQLEGNNICYGTSGDRYGILTLRREGFLVALKLEHVSGYLTCNRGKGGYYNSNWGCNADGDQGITNGDIGTFITDDKNSVIFPKNSENSYYEEAYYKVPGYKGDCNELVLSSYCTPMYSRENQEIRIWYGEDLFEGNSQFDVNDNGGLHCVNVYVKYLN